MNDVTAKTRYHHGDLRQQLITATRALVEEKGPDGFSVSEACRAAGVSTAAPYKHFQDRTEILQAVAMEGFGEMTEAFHLALKDKPEGSLAAIAAIGIAYVRFAEANPEVFRMMFAFKDKTEAMEASGMGCYGVLLGQIAAYLGQDEIDEAVLALGFPLWTFVHGLSFLSIDGKCETGKAVLTMEEMVVEATRRLLSEARPA
ncbi:TetR/AcrR family transcriptional regulator [Ovoidimarina sediminis]|uniref:TetR/AcrR family transcriptional regulator n=1 Tax=Ovoidimarina sediminis TaxID=3079856 RepID=UPI00290659D1|nr:TetR/AcrR family transcriptional regulator [Rhodophyticola sp. MJ-SS7]MDU8944992.1 TetR/AcrR family transcriptional regulator [Rhodophyticola sp. MJ-SS7]